jgi:hypothetical protein
LLAAVSGLNEFQAEYDREGECVYPKRVFVNQFPADQKSGMIDHEDMHEFCTVIVMLTHDDDETTALAVGNGREKSTRMPVYMHCGDVVAFRSLWHHLPECSRRTNRITINLFF